MIIKTRQWHWCRLSMWAIGLLVLAGCGGHDGRRAIEGTVTLDGEPLAKGTITFRPQPGTSSPTAGATISGGRFSVPGDKSVLAGTFRVEIIATRKTGKKSQDPILGIMVDEVEQYLPARYNQQSELTAEVTDAKRTPLNFALTSEQP